MKTLKLLALTAATLPLFVACGGEKDADADKETSNTETVKTLNQAWAKGDVATVDSFTADNYVNNTPDPTMPKPEGMSDKQFLLQLVEMYHSSSPDMRVEEKAVVAQGDWVAAFSLVSGTNTGDMPGMPATGKAWSANGADFYQFNEEGKIAATWSVFDGMAMMMQLHPEMMEMMQGSDSTATHEHIEGEEGHE